MKVYITEAQKRELETVANDGHAEAIMAAMADMYHEGWVDAGRFAENICFRTIGVGCAMYLIYRVGKRFVESKNQQTENEKES